VEPAVPDAREIFESASFLAKNTEFAQGEPAVLAECLPAGTTTALMVLRALGHECMVSSGININPVSLKERLWSECSSRAGIKVGGMSKAPLEAIREFGDPMQAAVLGFATGLSGQTDIILAGGTQMLAVAACLKALGFPGKLKVATTKYVALDETSSFAELAARLSVETYYAPLDFSRSRYKGLSDYELGYVKEGAGAGGAVFYASLCGIGADKVIARTESLYGEFAQPKVG
jgi:NaMN:DMB phosphoribosyltransferase